MIDFSFGIFFFYVLITVFISLDFDIVLFISK